MLKNKLGVGLLACWMAFLPLYGSFGFANEIESKRAQLSETQDKMREMEQRRDAARAEAEEHSAKLEQIMANLRTLQAEADQLQGQRDELQGRINENQAQLAAKKEEMVKRGKIYKRRLRDIYMNGQINYIDVLFGARDFGDFSTRMYLLQKIIKSDLEMIETIKRVAVEIETHQKELDSQMASIKETQAALEAKKARADKLRQQRASLLSNAKATEQQSEDEYERLMVESERIAVMLRNMESASQGGGSAPSAGGSGQFMWPCSGTITSYFGWRTHPVFGTTKYHSGMDIGVDYGTPIQAADSGTVVYSGWLGGYGYAVMINHGNGLVTLYGHNQSLNCSEGQYVGKGSVIAYAGSTGYSTGPHCHFEVRLHGDVVDPMGYLP